MDMENEVVVEAPAEENLNQAEQENNHTQQEAPQTEKTEDVLPKGVQKRIDRAVRQKYEAEARAKVLEERLAAIEARQARSPSNNQEDVEPTIDKFDNFDDYVAAKATYIAKHQIESAFGAREQHMAAAQSAAEQARIAETWGKRIIQATAELPDFEEVIASSDLPMTPVMRQAIMESDVGPRLAYYLATHPDEAVKVAEMSGTRAITALGRIEERLSANKQTTKATDAPAPITPVGTRSTVKKDPGKMSDAEYEKWRKGN